LSFIVDLPIENNYFPVRHVSLPEGKDMKKNGLWASHANSWVA
jgi:hypothetical protein